MKQLFVPIILNNNCNLYEITAREYSDSSSEFNGESNPTLNEKLVNYYNDKTFSFEICENGKNLEEGAFYDFSESTMSISLGVFCCAYATLNNEPFKKRYESITITGDFIIKDGNVILKSVSDIEEKFEAVKKFAKEQSESKHLFLYISSEDIIPEGIQENNVFVIRYDSNYPVECVFAEVFDSYGSDEKKLNENEFIETKTYINLKKDFILNSPLNGYVITGESNTGKSIATKALCDYLINCKKIEKYVWFNIGDNTQFWKILRDDCSPLNLIQKKSIIRDVYKNIFSDFDELLKSGVKCAFVVDNVEYRFVDEILDFFKRNYSNEKNSFKLLITSWEGCKYKKNLDDAGLKQINISDLALTESEFSAVAKSIIDSADYKNKFYNSSKELQLKFIDLLFQQCNKFPGYIPVALSSLSSQTLEELIKLYEEKDIKELNKIVKVLNISFSVIDIFSQLVLFSYLQVKRNSKTLEIDEIKKNLIEKIFNKKNIIHPLNIYNSLKVLKQCSFIEEIDNNIFNVKREALNYCVFSNELSKELGKARDAVITSEQKAEYAIENDKFEEFSKNIECISDKTILNELLIRLCEGNSRIDFFNLLLSKGADVNYADKDGHKPFDVYCCCGDSVEVLELLYNKGAIPSEYLSNGDDYFLLAVCRGNLDIINFLLTKKQDINLEKQYLIGLTIIQFCALLGCNTDVLELLINKGADKNSKTKQGWTLLQCAALNENSKMLRFILEKHYYSEIDELCEQGATALQLVCGAGKNQKNIQLLIEYGANKEVISPRGQTLLHLAVSNDSTEPLKFLLDNKVYTSLSTKNSNDQTALELAKELKNNKAIDILQEKEKENAK